MTKISLKVAIEVFTKRDVFKAAKNIYLGNFSVKIC